MVQWLTYRRTLSYNTSSNRRKIVKTPGEKLVYQHISKALAPKIQPYFVLGEGDENEEKKEIEEYGDIIIGSFLVTYENLPLKTTMGYQFENDHCKNVDFYFYQNDDTVMKFDQFFETQKLDREDPFMICPMSGTAGREEP